MNTILETMTPETKEHAYQRVVLNENRVKATLLVVEANEQIDTGEDMPADEHILFVSQGRATVRVGEVNHVLNQEQALHLAQGAKATIWNHGSTPAKLLRVDVRLPVLSEPMLVTMPPA